MIGRFIRRVIFPERIVRKQKGGGFLYIFQIGVDVQFHLAVIAGDEIGRILPESIIGPPHKEHDEKAGHNDDERDEKNKHPDMNFSEFFFH